MQEESKQPLLKSMLGEVGIELNASEVLVESSLRKRGRKWLVRPYRSNGQQVLTALLRRCPAPGVERPTRPTLLTYGKRGNPDVVWHPPVTQSQERANSAAGTRGLKKRRPLDRKVTGKPQGITGRIRVRTLPDPERGLT